MKKKLYSRMTAITVLVMMVTMLITVGIFHNLFSAQVIDDLRAHAHILKSTEAVLQYIEKDYDPKIDNLRITVIDNDGTVKYDSNADIGSMENHGNRPEVLEAIKNNEGHCVRKSETLEKNTYYYAEKLDDGRILRVAKEAGNTWQFIGSIIPALAAELILAITACIIAAKLLAKRLVQPIEQMSKDLDSGVRMNTYEEIQPFVDKIYTQHQDLKKSSQIRHDFTANVSHELKTPLASISGYAELIETGMAKDEDIQHFASEIHKSSLRLLSLINDIIELSQLDVMEHKKPEQVVNISDIAEECIEKLQMNANKNNVNMSRLNITENCLVYGNVEMIEEIIYNLCDNAIRYNKPDGHVWVSVFKENDRTVLQIKDDGIGIPKENQGRIFERFYRVDKARSKKTGGTGLGLAIVKHIAEQHNAQIVLESEIDYGTTISVKFMNKL